MLNRITVLDCFYALLRPILWRLPPEEAHIWSLKALKYAFALSNPLAAKATHSDGVTYWGKHFPNRLGLAAGADKNGEYIMPLFQLGFGFIEVEIGRAHV